MERAILRVGDKLPNLYPSTYTPDDIKADKALRARRPRPGERSPVEARVEWVHPEGRFVTVRFLFDGGSFCESILLGRSN